MKCNKPSTMIDKSTFSTLEITSSKLSQRLQFCIGLYKYEFYYEIIRQQLTLSFHGYYLQAFLTGVGLVTNYKHLSEAERGQIELMWKQGFKQAEIARTLKRSKSTISREIIRKGV